MMSGLPAVAFGFLTFLLLLPFARLDIDRHHDGYMVAQALAVHQGFTMHSQVFGQYGPVTPWLQSLALFLPVGPVLALRIANSALIAITVFAMADMGRVRSSTWPITRRVGWWSAVAWFLLADVWVGIPMLPWPPVLASALTVLGVYFLTRALALRELGKHLRANFEGVIAGAALGLVPFTRLSFGVSSLLVLAVCGALAFILRGRRLERTGWSVLMGVGLSLGAVLLMLLGTGSLDDYVAQAIIWPLQWASVGSGGALMMLASIGVEQAFPVVLVLIGVLVGSRWVRVAPAGGRKLKALPLLAVGTGVMVVLWENRTGLVSSWSDSPTGLLSARGWYLLLTAPNWKYLEFFLVLASTACVVTVVVLVTQWIRARRISVSSIPWIGLVGLSVASLTMVIPVLDTRHVWWALPCGLLLIFAGLGRAGVLRTPAMNPLVIPMAAILVMAVHSGATYLRVMRVEGPPGSISQGMLISSSARDSIAVSTEFLGRELSGAQQVLFLTVDGDLSVFDGRYRSPDAYFVNWGGSPALSGRIQSGIPVVLSEGLPGTDGIVKELQANGYSLAGESWGMRVFTAPQ
jgi:hypothetical protein